MGTNSGNNWQCDDLFEYARRKRLYTVSELTFQIRSLLEEQIGHVQVIGEISNLRVQNSGHWYFTLKDAEAQIACVLFKGDASNLRSLLRYLKDGIEVIVDGELTVYEPRGQYQIVVRWIEPKGIGLLQIRFEQLKAKLLAEGLFAPERKRPLPAPLLRVGVVTSPTGAAIRDFLQIVRRRFPLLEITLAPCRVQGEQAAIEIARAIHNLNSYSQSLPPGQRLQLIVVTRGGGSIEDLWAFNEEVVARAIYASELPIISAVGHEIDFTIADFVADLRAPTPSAAAELVTEWGWRVRRFLEEVPIALALRFEKQMHRFVHRLNDQEGRLNRLKPARQLQMRWQRLDEISSRLQVILRLRLEQYRAKIEHLAQRAARFDPRAQLISLEAQLRWLSQQFRLSAQLQLSLRQHRLKQAEQRLYLLSPTRTLERGFSITVDASSGRILRDPKEVSRHASIRTFLARGSLLSRVEQLLPDTLTLNQDMSPDTKQGKG